MRTINSCLVAALGVLCLPATVVAQVRFRYPLDQTSTVGYYAYHAGYDWNCGTNTYNMTDSTTGKVVYTHGGTDFLLPKGSPVIAAASGWVVDVQDGNRDDCSNHVPATDPAHYTSAGCAGAKLGAGNYVKLRHADGTYTVYMHLQKYAMLVQKTTPEQYVSCGEPIAHVGSSGRSTDPHLHFEYRVGCHTAGCGEDPYMTPAGATCAGSETNPSRWVAQGAYRSLPGATCDAGGGPTPPSLTLHLGATLRNRPVTIELWRTTALDRKNDPDKLWSTTTDANGDVTSFPLTGVSPNTYQVLVKPEGWLRRQRTVSLAAGPNTLDLQSLFAWGACNGNGCSGDIESNNKVDIFDYNWLVTDFGTSSSRSDLDGDGDVDIFDYNLLVGSFREYGDGGEISPEGTGAGRSWDRSEDVSPAATLAATEPSGGQLRLSAVPSTAQVGQVITLGVDFDMASSAMAGVDVLIDYDQCVLRPETAQIVHGGMFATTGFASRPGTFEYHAHKWTGLDAGASVPGTNRLVSIPLTVLAGVSSSTVGIRFRQGSTYLSNMDEDGTIIPILGAVHDAVVYATGSPQRPAQVIQVTSPSSGAIVRDRFVRLSAQASDPCGGLHRVTFSVYYDGEWHEVGTDTDPSDGWEVYWDADPVADQVVRVKAFAGDWAGNGAVAPVIDSVTLYRGPVAYPPGNLRVTGSTPNTVSLAWDDVSGETGYRIYKWDGVDSFDLYQQVGANTTSFTDRGLTCERWWWYEVSSYNPLGESSHAGAVAAVTQACAGLPTPSNFRVTGTTSAALSLGWNDVSSETGYRIYKWDGVDSFDLYRQLGANATSFTDTGLNCMADYWYELSAYNASGESGHAGWIKGTTQPCPVADVQLSNGVPYPDSMTAPTQEGTWRFYYLDVPAGATQLTVTLDQLTADLDLHVRAGAKPTLDVSDCSSLRPGTTNDACSVASPAAGRWWIGINNWDTGSISYRVTATFSSGSGDVQLSSGVPYPDSMTAAAQQDTWSYYYIDVAVGSTSLAILLDGLTADVDLYVRSGAKPSLDTYSCRPYSGGTSSENCSFTSPAAGRWWIGVNNYSVGTLQYRVTATLDKGFFTVTPCRVLDTRNATGPYGRPALVAGSDRTFVIAGRCGIPSTARAVSVNVTVTQPSAAGNLLLYPAEVPLPLASTIAYSAGVTRANNAIVSLSSSGMIAVRCAQASGTAHLILDVNGYFN